MAEKKKSKKGLSIIICFCIICFCIYKFTGFFVVQPIGAIPKGVTIWYWRNGYDIEFIDSADGIMLREDGGVSLLGRAILVGSVYDEIENKIILKLPYQKWMYKISTKGVEFEN
mgnify:CR=1 FL=1